MTKSEPQTYRRKDAAFVTAHTYMLITSSPVASATHIVTLHRCIDSYSVRVVVMIRCCTREVMPPPEAHICCKRNALRPDVQQCSDIRSKDAAHITHPCCAKAVTYADLPHHCPGIRHLPTGFARYSYKRRVIHDLYTTPHAYAHTILCVAKHRRKEKENGHNAYHSTKKLNDGGKI